MSGSRASIARLSLALRILLYAAFLTVIGHFCFSFSFSSGHATVPGDTVFDVARTV
jgi:hypothetical protein